MILIPLSRIGSPQIFAQAVAAHLKAMQDYLAGNPGQPIPVAGPDVDQVVARVPQGGHPATRGPDRFIVLPYEIIDDLPKPQEVVMAEVVTDGGSR